MYAMRLPDESEDCYDPIITTDPFVAPYCIMSSINDKKKLKIVLKAWKSVVDKQTFG